MLCRPVGPLLAFLAAVITGLCFPHMGHRNVESGGKAAVESVIRNAFCVGLLFLVSDFSGIQKLLLGGTELSEQHVVNVVVGSWIGLTLLTNLIVAARTKKRHQLESLRDLILFEDQYSPVGYQVPNFPDFIIDPSQAKEGLPFVSLEHEMYFAVFVAMVMMGVMLSLAFTNWTQTLEGHLSSLVAYLQS